MCDNPNDENEKYNLPCPYNPKRMCVQMPGDREVDDFYCDNGCPNGPKSFNWLNMDGD